jgi:hypothetical protein
MESAEAVQLRLPEVTPNLGRSSGGTIQQKRRKRTGFVIPGVAIQLRSRAVFVV